MRPLALPHRSRTERRRHRRRAVAEHAPAAAGARAPAARDAPDAPTYAAHRHGGFPQDRALYGCGCGCQFEATVSASVACPHCGATQAW